MSFRNIPDDLVLPPGGSLVPGSGTLYIGSKRIPADLLADGALAALVWYSNADGLAAGIDYWYIAHLRIGTQADLFQAGYKQTGLGRKAIWGGWLDLSGNQFTTFEAQQAVTLKSSLTDVFLTSVSHDVLATAARAVFIEGDFTGPGAVQLIAPNGTVSFGKASGIPGTGARVGGWESAGTKAYVKAINTVQEQWNTDTSTQTIGGIAGCTVKFDWRWTIDYFIDVRFFITCPAAPGVGAGAVNLSLPATFPSVDLSTGISRGGFTPCVGEGGTGFYPMMMRFNNGGTCDIFTENNPNGNTVFEGGGAFSLLKP